MPLYAIKREKELQHQSQALTVSHLLNTLTYVPLLYMDGGLRWCHAPTKHQDHSGCLCLYQGPCSVIKPALSKLGHEQSTEGHCKQYIKGGWQCFWEEWQRNHIWCCVHLLWLRFHGVGSGLQAHNSAWHSPLPQHLSWADIKVLCCSEWMLLKTIFHEETS